MQEGEKGRMGSLAVVVEIRIEWVPEGEMEDSGREAFVGFLAGACEGSEVEASKPKGSDGGGSGEGWSSEVTEERVRFASELVRLFSKKDASDGSKSIDELVHRLPPVLLRTSSVLDDVELDDLERRASGEERRDETAVGDRDVGRAKLDEERPVEANNGSEEDDEGSDLLLEVFCLSVEEGGLPKLLNDEVLDPLSSSGI